MIFQIKISDMEKNGTDKRAYLKPVIEVFSMTAECMQHASGNAGTIRPGGGGGDAKQWWFEDEGDDSSSNDNNYDSIWED